MQLLTPSGNLDPYSWPWARRRTRWARTLCIGCVICWMAIIWILFNVDDVHRSCCMLSRWTTTLIYKATGPHFSYNTSWVYRLPTVSSVSLQGILRIRMISCQSVKWGVEIYLTVICVMSGPSSVQTDNRILTHDFVHRTHLEIFKMDYYPYQLSDWWMDDW